MSEPKEKFAEAVGELAGEQFDKAIEILSDINFFAEEIQGVENTIGFLKSMKAELSPKVGPMEALDDKIKSDLASDDEDEDVDPIGDQEFFLNAKKEAHDYFATLVHILSVRKQFKREEFKSAKTLIQFMTGMRDQIRKDIELIEPPKAEEAKKPYDMDLTHVKGENQAEAVL